MSGLLDDLEPASVAAANPPTLPPAPKPPKSLLDDLEPVSLAPRAASGVMESIQAGFQGSAPGLAWRGKLPDLVIDPQHASWWERALSGAAHVGSELPLMIGGAIAGAPAGAALGTAVAPGVGTAVGSLLGAGAGMGAIPAAIRQSLIEAYKSGDVMTAADFWNSVREVAKTTATEAGINAAAMGAGAVAGRVVGKAIAPSIGQSISVPTAIRSIEAADIATQIAAMPTIPAILQGRLPDAQEFVDAAILIGGLKAAHVASSNIVSVFVKTGKTPAEQVADVQEGRVDPQEFVGPPEKPVDPEVLKALLKARLDAINIKLEGTPDKTVTGPDGKPITIPGQPKQFVSPEERAERDWLAANIDNADALAKRYSLKRPQQTEDEYVPPSRAEMLKVQENLFTETARLDEMAAKAEATPLSDPERLEMNALKARVLDLENQLRAGAPELSRTPTYTADQFVEARKQADTRLAELTTKAETEALTDTERAERVFLSNSLDRPTALAKHFGFEPILTERPTPQAIDASAQRIHDDVLQQLKDADEARKDAGLDPLGDDHAEAVAALVRARVRTRAERMGVLPESLYAERPVKIEDVNKLQGEPETPPAAEPGTTTPEAPAAAGPELDLFGEPIQPEAPAPRMEVQNLATQEIPLANLVLSKEVPQFKMQANKEGVVQPLGGLFDRTGVGPIQVWERLDGTLEVISGRHRLDLARRSGEQTIPAQIHREAEGFDARQAATLDAQLNIREEQGSVADYAQYFKDAGIDKATAEQRGLLARTKGRTGFAIARDASPDLLASHRAGRLSDEAALVISSTAPGSERLQALGIAAVQDGKTLLYASNLMRSVDMMAAERMMAGEQGDIFGFDDSALKEASAMAKKASSKQRAISEQIAAVSGASKRPELARKMGVNVEDPAAVQAKILELKQEQYLWDNWPLYPELVAKLRSETLKQEMRQLHPDAWADAPRDERDYYTNEEIIALEHKPYVENGVVKASSRTTPNMEEFPPVGSWRISSISGLYGREIEQLVKIPVDKLLMTELDSKGRLDPVKAGDDARYAEWLKEGKRAPPINVVQTDSGQLNVVDGHRRALAAKLAGATEIEAWVNYAVPIPSGGRYSGKPDGKFIRTGMTMEMLQGEVANPFMDRMKLYQNDIPLKAETPAEAAARDQVAADAAARTTSAEVTRTTINAIRASAAVMDANSFLDKYVGELLPEHLEHKIYPARQIHGTLDPRLLDPSEAEEWAEIEINPDTQSSYAAGKQQGQILIRGTPDDLRFRQQVVDGHHRVAAAIAAGANVDVIYDLQTLAEIWKRENGSPQRIREIKADYQKHLNQTRNTLFQDIHDRWYRSALGEAIQNANMKAAPAKGWQDFLKGQVAKEVLKKLGGGKIDEVDFGQPKPKQEGWSYKLDEDGDYLIISPDGEVVEISHSEVDARRAVQSFANHSDMDVQGAPETNGPTKQPGFEITPAMREGAMAGQPLFQKQADQLHRGSYDIAENLITTLQGADKSTVVHELTHSWLEEMKADAARPDAPASIKADWEIIRRELAIPETGEISRASHEQFARTGERYLAEGEAPSRELQSVFARFREWLLDIYKSVMNLNVEINPELRQVLDRMLATDEEIAAARDLGVPRAYVPEAAAAAKDAIVPPPEARPARRKINPGFEAEQASMQPYADELPPGPGEAPDNIHVNYAYINTPTDVKLAMQRMAEIDQANIQRQRGGTEGVKSWAEANAEQAKYLNDILGGGPDTLHLFEPRDPDAPHVDVRLGILKKLAVGAAKDSARLRDVVLQAGHDATVRQQLEYMGSIERARMIQAEFLGERASVARALNALKDVTEGTGEIGRMLEAIGLGDEGKLFQAGRTPAEEQAYLKAKLDEILQNYKGKSVLDIAKLHKEIGTLKGTFKLAKEVSQATRWEQIVEGWRAGLLSGPVTHTTNLLGTEAFHVMRPAVDALATIIGMARGASPGMGESDRASMSEAVARLTGMLGGVQDGIKVAIAEFKADEATGKTEAYRTAIPGQAGRIIRTPLRLMGAEDALVTTMYTRGEIRTLAIRQAFDEDLNPSTREFAERVAYLQDNPTPEMQVAAETAATRMTFNAPLGEKGVALQGFVNKWNLQWVIPFIRTPINIAKELLRMSPFAPAIGEWRAAIAKGGVERDRALAEMALGSGIMAITMAYAFAGNVSGAGSPDPGKNRGKAGVWQPYSILIGDTWYEYARIQPTGTLMGMAADMAAVWDHMTDEEKDKVPKMLSAAFAQAITNQTFLQGIANFVNALSDPTRFGPRFLQSMAGSLVPNIIGQPTTMADPVVREVNSALESIQARIPGMRQDLLPKRDWLGEPVKTKERVGMVMPIREQQVSDDKVRLEAARLDISMAAAPRKTHIGKGTGKLGDVKLTPEERDAFEKIGGEFAHGILQNIVNAPGYDQMPDMVKRKIFSNVLTAAHRVAAVQAMPMEKRIAYLQEITEKVQQELTPGDAP